MMIIINMGKMNFKSEMIFLKAKKTCFIQKEIF